MTDLSAAAQQTLEMFSQSHTQRFTVRIRRDIGRGVKPEAEQLDGKTYEFRFGWMMNEDDPYPGEEAWIAHDPTYPIEAPVWIASGDLA